MEEELLACKESLEKRYSSLANPPAACFLRISILLLYYLCCLHKLNQINHTEEIPLDEIKIR